MTTLFAVFQLLLVVLNIQPVLPVNEKLNVVFTMRKQDFGEVIGPAMLEPIQRISNDLHVDINWTIIDTNNSTEKIVSEFFSTIKDFEPNVIIGETMNPCCEVMATLASAIDRLFISIGCNPFQFMLDKESFPTFASARSIAFSFGLIVDKVMEKFNWKRVALINSLDGEYPIRTRYLKMDLKKKNREIFSYVHAASNQTLEDFQLRKNAVNLMLRYLSERATRE